MSDIRFCEHGIEAHKWCGECRSNAKGKGGAAPVPQLDTSLGGQTLGVWLEKIAVAADGGEISVPMLPSVAKVCRIAAARLAHHAEV